MGIWTDIAEWRGPTPNHGGPMLEQRGLVEHIAEGTFEGTISWCKNPASQVSAHFVVARDGRIAQLVDTDVTAWTQIEGNGHWLSVENEGFTPNPLTNAQVEASAVILAKGHEVYGYPLTLATCPSDRGLGHHSMGAECGVNWGHSRCPGPAVKAQKPVILDIATQIIGGDMPISDQDIDRIVSALLGQLLGTSGPTVGVALQSTYSMVKELSESGSVDDVSAILAAIDNDRKLLLDRLAAAAQAETDSLRRP